MPASGKSTLGQRLAQKQGWHFVDLDHAIATHYGASIGQIFAQEGEQEFRKLEAQTLRNLRFGDNTVLSVGGGTPCFHQNIAYLNTLGYTVFVDTPLPVIVERTLAAPDERPLYQGLSVDAVTQKVDALYQARLPYYLQARYRYVP
jgi:shikimate kinase